MARQKGLMKYIGTIGDVRHFKIKGEKGYFAGMVGGPTAEQVLTGDEFKRTRENMSEFGGCAKVGKAIRTAFGPLKHMFSRRLTGNHLTAIIKRINLEDGSEARGQRAILLTQVPQHLQGLDFDPALSLTTVLRSPFDVVEAAGRKGSTLVVPKFHPQNALRIPSGVSHFRLVNVVAAISDFALSTETGSYEPKVPEQNGVTGTAFTDYLEVTKETDDINLEATFLNGMEPKAEVAVLNAVGVEFYQKVGDNFYLFASDNAMQFVDVF